jgi:PTS system mannitol-specific IIC component
LSVLLAATTSFLVASVILRASRRREEGGDLAAATAQMEGMKGKESSISSVLTQVEASEAQARTEPIRKIVFACDAGMGSSAMGASVLRNKIKKAGFGDVSVINVAIANLDDSYDLVVTHQDLTLRARDRTPSAQHVSVTNFMNSPRYDEIVEELQHTNAPQDTSAPS